MAGNPRKDIQINEIIHPKAIHTAISGAFAGLVNTVVLHPLDLIKTKLQVEISRNAPRKGLFTMARSVWRTERISGFYRGLGAALCAFVPNWTIYWYSYELFKRFLPAHFPSLQKNASQSESQHLLHIYSAVSAGAITAVATSPLWTIKTRMQVERNSPLHSRKYKTVFGSGKTIVKEEGFRALYKGLAPSLLGLIHVAVQFPMYEILKQKLMTGEKPSASRGIQSRAFKMNTTASILVASSVSKVSASLVAYPHEVIRSRMQADTAVRSGFILKEAIGIIAMGKQIWKTEGVHAFYAGLTANLLRTVPSCMITFSCYEFAKRRLQY